VIVDGFVVVLLVLRVGREKAEASVTKVMVDCPAASLATGEEDSLLLHELTPALFPRILVATDDNGWRVTPQEKGGAGESCLLK
jgi:hypothetical protein